MKATTTTQGLIKYLFFLLFAFSAFGLSAQEAEESSQSTSSRRTASTPIKKGRRFIPQEGQNLDQQFQSFIKGMIFYNNYYSAKDAYFQDFYGIAKDSLTNERKDLATAKNRIKTLKDTVSTLNKDIATLTQERDKARGNVANIEVFGGSMDKNAFSTLMFIIVVVLIAVAVILLMMFLRSNAVTQENKKKFSDLDNEYNDFKQRSMDRETKLRRELQTERNKLDELTKRGKL